MNEEDTRRLQRRVNTIAKSDFDQRGKIHVTNLLWCLQKAVFRLRNPVNESPNRWMVKGTLTHKQVEPILAETFTSQTGQTTTEEKITWRGITGTIDVLGDTPIEFKTSEFGKMRSWYIEQLMSYCVMTKTDYGKIVTWAESRTINTPKDALVTVQVWDIDFSQAELKDWANIMLGRKSIVMDGVESDDGILDVDDINRKVFECRTCSYAHSCPYYVYAYRSKRAGGWVVIGEPYVNKNNKFEIGVFDSLD